MDDGEAAGWELERALRELGWINRLLGGWRTTRNALEEVVPAQGGWSMLDVGTGGGDIPLAAAHWSRRRGQPLQVVALDFNAHVCRWAARETAGVDEVQVCQADIAALPFAPDSFDVVHCGMFLHHFPQERAAEIVGHLYRLCRRGVIINDLHRHPVAYYFTRHILCRWARSPMVQHDAPLSVLRGFTRRDLAELQDLVGVEFYKVLWQWAFRYLVVLKK